MPSGLGAFSGALLFPSVADPFYDLRMQPLNRQGNFTGYVIAAAATVSVLTFGAVEPLGFAPAQLSIILLAGYVFWQGGPPRLPTAIWLLLAAMLLLPLVQLVPLPRAVHDLLSLERSRITESLQSAAVPVSGAFPVSVYPFATAEALLRWTCYVLVFLLAFRNYQQRLHQPALMGLLLGLGLFEACYGITQYLTGFQYIFFYKKAVYSVDATGTYINRNHYAGLLEMSLPFIAAAMLGRAHPHTKDGKGLLKHLLVSQQSSRFLRDAVLVVVILIGLVFSLSRAGITAGLIGIGVSGALVLQRHRRSALAILALLIPATGAYVFWIGYSPILERFGSMVSAASAPELRLAIWRDTLELIKDFPLVGTGLGTFQWSSLHYQSAWLTYRYEHAHNDILQTAAEVGIPLAVLIWGGLWVLLIQVVRIVAQLERSSDRVLAAGCAGAMTALLLHSLADFNLQIPANALIFAWIAGTAAALVHRAPQPLNPTPANNLTIDVTADQ